MTVVELFVVFDIYSMSMKMPEIIERAKEALEQGYCVVIGLQTTGEVRMLSLFTMSLGITSGCTSTLLSSKY